MMANNDLQAQLMARRREVPMTRKLARAKRTMAFVIAGLLSLPSTSMGQGAAPHNEADRKHIMTIVDSWEKAWNTHDMRTFASLFHEDGIWVLWTGEVWKGRAAIEEGHAAVHRTVFRSSVQRERLEELTFVGPDAAVVRFYSTLTGDERSPDKIVRSRKILIVTRRQGSWRVGWGQNTRLADTTPD
jgi:uncharacterized protein (TIGR02246 family)